MARSFVDSTGQTRVLWSLKTYSAKTHVANLTRPNDDAFPYRLKPRGWSRKTDPFETEARTRLEATA